MVLASCMEFAGSVGVGARVADTIRTKIVDTSLFAKDPALLMLGMVCAVTASSIYLTLATRIGMPVSTTHSIMGGVLGMGVASVGANGASDYPGAGSILSSPNSSLTTSQASSGSARVAASAPSTRASFRSSSPGSSPPACRPPLRPSSSSSPSTASWSARTRPSGPCASCPSTLA